MFFLLLGAHFCFAAENISLAKDNWILQNYGTAKPNIISFVDNKINIAVNSSSSALIYKLERQEVINSIHADISIDGDIKYLSQNNEFEEDSYFRFGLVVLGKNKLTAWAQWISPAWVQNLFLLVPKGSGLDKVYFYNVGQSEKSVGQSRNYPQSSYVVERVVAFKNSKKLSIDFKLDSEKTVAAIWISADADQTQSVFTTTIERLKLDKVGP